MVEVASKNTDEKVEITTKEQPEKPPVKKMKTEEPIESKKPSKPVVKK